MGGKTNAGRAVTFAAAGDVDLSCLDRGALERAGLAWPFERMIPHLARADLRFGNMESVVLPPDYPDDQIDPAGLVTKFNATAALAEAGFDFMNLAANHVLDGGQVGLFHTRDLLEALGIATAGVGRTQAEARRMRVVRAGGLRFGFLSYAEDNNYTLGTTGPGPAYYATETVLADIAASRPRVDVLVVSVHADLEFMPTPSWPRREAFRRFAAAGATIVLGHHPHVPQGVEVIDGSLVAYSLGNFHFPAHSSPYMKDNGPHTAHSFLLLAEVSGDGVRSFERVPFQIGAPPEERPIPLNGAAGDDLLAYLAELDRLCADDDAVRATWRDTALRHLDLYLGRIKTMDRQQVLDELLGRLLLVDENRRWVEEVFAAVEQRWAEQQGRRDPLHRPDYRFASRRRT